MLWDDDGKGQHCFFHGKLLIEDAVILLSYRQWGFLGVLWRKRWRTACGVFFISFVALFPPTKSCVVVFSSPLRWHGDVGCQRQWITWYDQHCNDDVTAWDDRRHMVIFLISSVTTFLLTKDPVAVLSFLPPLQQQQCDYLRWRWQGTTLLFPWKIAYRGRHDPAQLWTARVPWGSMTETMTYSMWYVFYIICCSFSTY